MAKAFENRWIFLSDSKNIDMPQFTKTVLKRA